MDAVIFLSIVFAPIVLISVFALYAEVRRKRDGMKAQRGASPSQGGTVVTGSEGTGEGSFQSAMVIPRDPQKYAKAMAPKR